MWISCCNEAGGVKCFLGHPVYIVSEDAWKLLASTQIVKIKQLHSARLKYSGQSQTEIFDWLLEKKSKSAKRLSIYIVVK